MTNKRNFDILDDFTRRVENVEFEFGARITGRNSNTQLLQASVINSYLFDFIENVKFKKVIFRIKTNFIKSKWQA